MDTMRAHDDADGAGDFDYADDGAIDTPVAFGLDERRMQLRAYNYWASLLGNRTLPSIEDLVPGELEDFGSNSVLLDFTTGLDNPAIAYLGTALRQECDVDGSIAYINDVPARSLLSRLTDHYLQIVANEAPVGFEAEFINQRGIDILYRGILMPFSSDGETIDFAFGVINWKTLASRAEVEVLEEEFAQAMLESHPHRATQSLWDEGPSWQQDAFAALAQEDLLDLAGMEAPANDDEAEDDDDDVASPVEPATDTTAPDADAPLADWLAIARDGADRVRSSEARSHAALYRAVSLAYDFALVARARAADYGQLLADHGIKAQARSPMTAIVKLVFGTGYDKTRITEYATTLDHGLSIDLGVGQLADHLRSYPGGLKALVRDHRAMRRADAPARPDRSGIARSALRQAPPLSPEAIATDEDGFAILVARREADGSFAFVASLPADMPLTQKVLTTAAR